MQTKSPLKEGQGEIPLVMTCLQIIFFFLWPPSVTCALCSSWLVYLVLLSLSASVYSTCQKNHPGPVKSQCVSWDYLRLPLLAFLFAEPDWKPSWRLMRSGDPLYAHSPLRISPPCKNSKVKPWAKPLLRGRAREGVGAELIWHI